MISIFCRVTKFGLLLTALVLVASLRLAFMVRCTFYDTLAFLLLLSLLLPSGLIMFIPSTFKRPVSSWKALNLRKTLLMASSVRLKPLNCSRLPCVYAQETLTFLLTQKKTCAKYPQDVPKDSGKFFESNSFSKYNLPSLPLITYPEFAAGAMAIGGA